MYRLIQLTIRRLTDTQMETHRMVDSQLANYLACNSQTPKLQTRKHYSHILESLQLRLCVHRDMNIVAWFMLISKM